MKYDISRIVGLFVFVMVLSIFWQPLVLLLIVLMVALLVFGLVVLLKSSKVKDEINQDPEKYFSQYETGRRNQEVSVDVIDVEYTEKEVSSND